MKALDTAIQRLLKRHDTDMVVNDGMDIVLVCFDRDAETLHYANAQSFGMLVSSGHCVQLETQKLSIGGHMSKSDKKFHTFEIPFAKGDRLYLFSDGYADQFGGSQGKKFLRKNLQSLIMELQHLDLQQQQLALQQGFTEWKGAEAQVDDVTIIGIER